MNVTLPKADLHVHQEADARLDRVLARREDSPPYDWRAWVERLPLETPPGLLRLLRMDADRRRDRALVDALDAEPENVVARLIDLLTEGAAEGAILIEVRCGRPMLQQPDFLTLFREAERRVRQEYPRLRAEAVISGLWPPLHDPDGSLLRTCLDAARDGLAGIDFIPLPYDTEADWAAVYPWAAQAAAAGLGITAHAGEFSSANLAAALRVPGLSRLGHAVYAAAEPRILEALARRGITVECSLTSNVVLGATPCYEDHPIRQFVACGVPVALATDDPVRVATTIGREYAVAAGLGFTSSELLAFTRNAVAAAFTTSDRRATLLAELHAGTCASGRADAMTDDR